VNDLIIVINIFEVIVFIELIYLIFKKIEL
jgi:hypothetical protein